MDTTTTTDVQVPAKTQDADPRARFWLRELEGSKTARRELLADWSVNVDYRRGKQFTAGSDSDRIKIPFDWSATKAKQAQLFSQVPEVRLAAKAKQYQDGLFTFAKKLNDTLERARVGVAMDECLPDVINASGIAGVEVAYESITQPRDVPSVPAEVAAMLQQQGQPVPMETIQFPVSSRVTIGRISPGDLLWPKYFTGSDFDDGPWIGRTGRLPWVRAKKQFNLDDADKDKVLGQDTRTSQDMLSGNDIDSQRRETLMVEYDEIFYWRYLYHEDETDYDAIHHLVFVAGINAPVVDEPWQGQKRTQDGKIVGPCKRPIRILTLTYMSDECVPPSDSAVGRPQVDELIRSRTMSMQQRENSVPLRWMNVNRLDALVQDSLLRGTWQGIIPINGDGDKAVGEVARASYPQDDYRFDDVAHNDLSEAWQVSPNQLGGRSGPAIRSASEAQIMQSNFQTRVGYERARCVAFFCGIAEVVGGLLCVTNSFTPEEQQALQGWDLQSMSSYYFYQVRADATVLLDSTQRLDRLERFLNLTAKSGYVNVKPIITEMTLLSGLDPADVVIDLAPQGPEPVKIAMSGKPEELNDPMFLAFLLKTQQAPSADDINAAKQLLMTAGGPVQPPQQQPGVPGMPPGAGAPGVPPAPVPPTEDAHPNWNTVSRVEKRAEDGKQ